MPTLKPTLTLVSTLGTAGVSENATLALSVTDELTVTDPTIGISKVACTTTGANTEILPSLDVTRYVYIKNTGLDAADAATTASIKVETADGARIIDLAADEFCFFPHHAEAAGLIQLEANSLNADGSASSGTVIAEYGYWTKG
tara:strand:- start:9 stop:440 length:432 start_codon:yes stop_codon:yes gene_type:complete